MRRPFLLGILLAALAATPALAGEPTWQLNGNDSSYSYVCGGDDWVAVTGKGNQLTITGECALVDIIGSGNKVSIEAVGSITIKGDNNDVRYERVAKDKPKPVIKNKGKANTIRKRPAPPKE
jgi:sorbitol-specific phosphotransferase system component IIA